MRNHKSVGRLRSLGAVALTLAATLGSACGNSDICSAYPGTCVIVHVVGTARSVEQLAFTLSGAYNLGPDPVTGSLTQPRTLPFEFAIPIASTTGGMESLLVTAVDNDHHSLDGQIGFSLPQGEHYETQVKLVPFTTPVSDPVDMAK